MSGEEKKINRWRWPIGIGVGVALAATIAVGVGSLIAHDQKPQAAPAAFTTVSPSPSAALDAHAKKACEMNEAAADQVKLLDARTVQAILDEAKLSDDFDVRFAAQILKDEQEISSAAVADDSSDAKLQFAALDASMKMTAKCSEKGYINY